METTSIWYTHAQRVYHMHNTKNVGEYNNAYCIIDYMQLTDCKENFSINIHGRYKLHPLSFLMLPSLSWEAA